MRLGSGLLAMILVTGAAPSQARDRFTVAVGGTGGGPFVLRCPAGSVLTGLSSRQGAYFNYVAPICNGQVRPGAGGTGQQRDASCPAGNYIGDMTVVSLRSPNKLLKAIVMTCYDGPKLGGGQKVVLNSPGEYTDYFKFFNNSSPYPWAIISCGTAPSVGLQGRSGVSIDALGLICDH